MELHVIRHGVTAWNLEGRYNGTQDDCLTPEQVEALACVRFDPSAYDAVYCSPLRRCTQTAKCLRIEEYVSEPRISERNLGIFEGKTREECRDAYPDHFAAFLAFDEHYAIPGGESRAQNLARVLEWLREASRFSRVLAITHGGTIDFLYRMGSGAPLHGGTGIFAGSNASLSEFPVNWPEVHLGSFDVPVCR